MLIKKGKLHHERQSGAVNVVDFSEAARASQLEIQKAKHEAKLIKQEAQEVLDESQKRLKEAEAKARQIIQDVNLEAKRIKEKVYNETLSAAKEEAEHLKNEARGLLIELFEVKREALTQAHKEIIKIALDLAEKVIKYQASIDPEILKRQVVEAIKKATSEADRVQVFVNPQDIKVLEDSIMEMKKLFPTGVDIVPLTNESVDIGSCIVETKSGRLDASFSTQIKALTDLTSHLEVIEPQFEIEEENKLITFPEVDKEILSEEWEEETQPLEDNYVLTEEEEELKEELLGDEPLIQLPQEEETFPFIQEEDEMVQEAPESQVVEPVYEGPIVEIPPEISENIIEKSQPKKKKLDLGNLLERTQEEKDELDELDDDFEYEEEQISEEETKPKNVLKPKKTEPSREVSKIAKELEENPEWKDLVEDEE